VECTGANGVVVSGFTTDGDIQHCLTDTVNGIQYFYTLARVEGGFVTAEGGPSPATNPQKAWNGATSLLVGVYGGTATSGATYIGIYRQGGLLQDAYLVDYFPLNTNIGNTTVFDVGYPDLEIVSNGTLTRNLWGTWPVVNAVSQPFHDRIFLGTGNSIFWSAPGSPSKIQNISETVVSDTGDPVEGLIVWDRLIIVNQNSVYEMDGTVFEGPSQDWVLHRTGSRRGSVAPKTIIKTPYGILLVGNDGMSLYTPGYGIDTNLDWVTEKIGDIWRGTNATDPAATKGGRCFPLNFNQLSRACATYVDGKIYFAPGLGTGLVYVLDLIHKTVQMYSYGGQFEITSLYWDYIQNRLIAGTGGGQLVQIETGHTDINFDGSPRLINWTATTRQWTTPNDMVLENLQYEVVGGDGGVVLDAIVDGVVQQVGFPSSNTTKSWTPGALLGTVGRNVEFAISGNQQGLYQQAIYQMAWDAIIHPPQVTYWKTDTDSGGSSENKIWDTNWTEYEVVGGVGTITSVGFVDNIAIMTNTFVGSGRFLQPWAWPNETYGYLSYSTYTSAQPFKVFKTYNLCRPEPALVTNYTTSRFEQANNAEQWFHTVFYDINPGFGIVLGTVYVDEQAVMTNTMTGSGRIVRPFAFPTETFGATVYVKLNAQNQGLMKSYNTWYKHDPEPPRVLNGETTYIAMPSENTAKTWLPTINPQGGVVTGTVDIDGTVIATATFTGTLKQVFEIGFANITTGKHIHAVYTGTKPFKYYDTNFEFEPKPFTKSTWLVTYKKVGGATQMDLARFYSMDVEGTATITSTWFADNIVLCTNTITCSGRQYFDIIPFPPGCRGYLFMQQVTASAPVKIWKSNLDIERIGVKGFSRVTYAGTPAQGN